MNIKSIRGVPCVHRTAKSVTASGNAHVHTGDKKFGTASAAFDGTGDWLSIPNSADFDISTGNFTIDFWVYFDSSLSYHIPFGREKTTAPYTGYYMYYTATDGKLYWITDANQNRIVSDSGAVSTNTWTHIAVVGYGGVTKMYVNGSQVGGAWSGLPENYDIDFYIGSDPSAFAMKGYIDEFRFTKGISRWTSSFTPPTVAYDNDFYCKLLLHCDGTDSSTSFPDDVTGIKNFNGLDIASVKSINAIT